MSLEIYKNNMVIEYESKVLENFTNPSFFDIDEEECTVSLNDNTNQDILSKNLQLYSPSFVSNQLGDTYSDTEDDIKLLRLDVKEDLSTKDKTKKTQDNSIESKTGKSQYYTCNEPIQMIQPQSNNDEVDCKKKDSFKEFEEKVCFNLFSRALENAKAEAQDHTIASNFSQKTEFNRSDINNKDDTYSETFSSLSFCFEQKRKIFVCEKMDRIISYKKFDDLVQSKNPDDLNRSLADVIRIMNNDQPSVCRSKRPINKKIKLQMRKNHLDSINKKLKTSCLNSLSNLLGINDCLFSEYKKSNSISKNNPFNQKSLNSLIFEELQNIYKPKSKVENTFKRIKENLESQEFLMMTFGEYFNKVYLASNYFKNLLRENSKDVVYLKMLIKQALSYVYYFENTKPNKPPKIK